MLLFSITIFWFIEGIACGGTKYVTQWHLVSLSSRRSYTKFSDQLHCPLLEITEVFIQPRRGFLDKSSDIRTVSLAVQHIKDVFAGRQTVSRASDEWVNE